MSVEESCAVHCVSEKQGGMTSSQIQSQTRWQFIFTCVQTMISGSSKKLWILKATCRMKDLYVYAQQHEHDSNTCSTITVIGLSCSIYINHACKTMSPKSLQFMNLPQIWHRGHSLWCILVGNSKSGPMHEKGIRSCIPYSTECSCFSTPFPQIPSPCMYSTYIHVHSNILKIFYIHSRF